LPPQIPFLLERTCPVNFFLAKSLSNVLVLCPVKAEVFNAFSLELVRCLVSFLFAVFFLCGRRTQISVWFVPHGLACSSPSASGPDFCCWLLVSVLRSRFPVSCLLPADPVFFSLPFFNPCARIGSTLHLVKSSKPPAVFRTLSGLGSGSRVFLAATIFSFTRFVLASAALVCVTQSFSSRSRCKLRRLCVLPVQFLILSPSQDLDCV
jgi:hypothetical protein